MKFVALGIAACLLAASSASAQGIAVGEKVADFEFRSIVLNGDGRTRISEFLGQPVLIEFWGTR
jgi:hypothetical protein